MGEGAVIWGSEVFVLKHEVQRGGGQQLRRARLDGDITRSKPSSLVGFLKPCTTERACVYVCVQDTPISDPQTPTCE